jgi:hypothetical protein
LADIVFKVDAAQVKALGEAMGRMNRGRMHAALRRAVNRIGDRSYTLIARTISEETGAQQKRVRKALIKKPATYELVYKTIARDQYMTLKDFRPRQTAGGVKTSLKTRSGGGQFVPRAFILPELGGHVFIRVKPARVLQRGPNKGKKREPLKKLYGPALPVQLIRGKSGRVVNDMLDRDLFPECFRQVNRELDAAARETLGRAKATARFAERIL